MSTEMMSSSLQENLLTLIVFDDKSIPLLYTTLTPGHFENDFYRSIVKASFDFYAEFKKAPNDHIADLFETHLLKRATNKESQVYARILRTLHNNKDNINRDYALSQLSKFVRQQTLKDGIISAHQLIKDGKLDEAELKMSESLNKQISIFDPGVWLTDLTRSLKFLTDPIPVHPLGIPPLDQLGFGPAPGQLLVILAPANRGKSFFCLHIAKVCAMQRLKVLYISLEMSEEKISQRFFQSFFAVTKRQSEVLFTKFDLDEIQRLRGFDVVSVTRPSLKDADIKDVLSRKMSNFSGRLKIFIKRFPTNALSIRGLEAYLDGMERYHNYIPDVLIVDYADLLAIDAANLRVSTGFTYKELRRIAVERNIAVVSPSQSNRLGEDARVVTLRHLGEDYSKAATADDIVAYCQTSAELRLGLARLFIAKARDEEREQTILISQAYKMAQFCCDSVMVSDRYWSLLDANTHRDSPTEEVAQEPEPKANPVARRRNYK